MGDMVSKVVMTMAYIGAFCIGAILSGTFVWLLWPVVIPVVFPSLVASGVIAGKLSWWVAVCFTWLTGLLFKSSATVNKCKE